MGETFGFPCGVGFFYGVEGVFLCGDYGVEVVELLGRRWWIVDNQ